MKELLAIIDTEKEYGKRLSEGLGELPDFPYTSVFTDTWEDFPAFCREASVRLVLTDALPGDETVPAGLPILVFSKSREEGKEKDRIFRYQPLEKIAAEILEKETLFTVCEPEDMAEKTAESPEKLRKRLYEKLLSEMDFSEELSDEGLYLHIDRLLFEESKQVLLSEEGKTALREALYLSLRQYDALSLALKDPEVTEVMINGPDRIFIEKNGRMEEFPEHFLSEEKLLDVVQRIASAVNRRVNEATPMTDAMLPDGARVNLVLPPISLSGPIITVRRFPKNPITMEDLVRMESISEEAARFLETLVECGYNLFISGGTGAGKTTFLGALASGIPPKERIVTIEDSPELRIRNVKNIVRLRTRPANLEGLYEVTVRQLIRNALRMRPDRIIVGEIRSGEALDMLQAMNTGHDGSLSTGHANSASDMLFRIETMALMGGEKLSLAAVRHQIASAIDILVHLDRLRDLSRRVTGIYEVRGMDKEEVKIAPLFVFREEGESDGRVVGRLVRTEERLENTGKLEKRGKRLPKLQPERSGNAEGPEPVSSAVSAAFGGFL